MGPSVGVTVEVGVGQPGVDEVTSPFDKYAKGVISDDRPAAIVTVRSAPIT